MCGGEMLAIPNRPFVKNLLAVSQRVFTLVYESTLQHWKLALALQSTYCTLYSVFSFIFFIFLCNFVNNLILLCCLWATNFPPWDNKGIYLSVCISVSVCLSRSTSSQCLVKEQMHWIRATFPIIHLVYH